MKKLSEKEIIRIFASVLGISNLDDVATLSNIRAKNIVFKSDMLVQSTDVPPGMKPWQIARKSIVSCVSDLSAKGAEPLAAMISLGIPADSDKLFINGLANGFKRASKEFGVNIVGGDTNESQELVIDCSMLGLRGKVAPTRHGAKPNDLVVVSGKFGLQPSGLRILVQNTNVDGRFKKKAVQSVLLPTPRQKFGLSLSRYFSSSIDSSDGLAISLYEIAAQSKVDIIIDKIPCADGVREFATELGYDSNELVFHGGEEYEIVATIPSSRIENAVKTAKESGQKMQIIGRVEKGNSRVFVSADGKRRILANRGYQHFD